jgi:CheY-like chemotaxis protein
MLSHELRNPLAAMHGVIELMSRGQTDPASLARIREVLTRQNRHLTRLIEDLLDVSRITRGTLTLRCEAVDARVIVQHALEATAAAVAARGHEIAVAMPDAPVMVWGDPVRLTQVVTNLLDNAAKFTPPGGHIRLDMSDRETGPTGKPWVTIDVEDDGCGIDARLLPEIFEPLPHFERMHRGIHGGLGIGLTVVRNLVLMHGGRAQVHSDGPERGSRFTVRLPLHDRTMTPTTMSLATSSDNKSGVPALRILVVDDNEDSAESMSLLLQCDGHRVDTAYSGEAALRIATEQPPDVMLLDIGMPGMMGYEVAERLRAGNFARTLLIAVTGYGRDSDIARARAAGFDHHLVKPVDYDKLRAMLAERFGGSPGAGARP